MTTIPDRIEPFSRYIQLRSLRERTRGKFTADSRWSIVDGIRPDPGRGSLTRSPVAPVPPQRQPSGRRVPTSQPAPPPSI